MTHRLEGGSIGLRALVAAVDEFALRCGWSSRDATAVQVSLDEVLSNALKYGGAYGMVGVTVALTSDAGTIRVMVADDGTPFDPLTGKRGTQAQTGAGIEIGGRGLRMVRGLMQEIDYVRDGRINRLTLLRRRRDDPKTERGTSRDEQ